MANNRIYLRCNRCGDTLFLGKDFTMGFYWQNYANDGKHLEDRLNEFYAEHTYCDREPVKNNYAYSLSDYPIPNCYGYAPGDYSIVYELKEEYPKEEDQCQEHTNEQDSE